MPSIPQVPQSDEVSQHAFAESVLGGASNLRPTLTMAAVNDLRAELDGTHDPLTALDLIEKGREALVSMVGACILAVARREIIEERAAFEAEFGV